MERPSDLKERTKLFAIEVIRCVEGFPSGKTGDVIGRQLLRSGTSIGANYRSACRGRSTAEFIAKLGIVEEEADESGYWLELARAAQLAPAEALAPLLQEADELLAITVASILTARRRPGAR